MTWALEPWVCSKRQLYILGLLSDFTLPGMHHGTALACLMALCTPHDSLTDLLLYPWQMRTSFWGTHTHTHTHATHTNIDINSKTLTHTIGIKNVLLISAACLSCARADGSADVLLPSTMFHLVYNTVCEYTLSLYKRGSADRNHGHHM